MCGIAGYWAPLPRHQNDASLLLDSISVRGPDNKGSWEDGNGTCLVHSRLSILDLSESGSQPIHSSCGRYVITYNGEIYNHIDLRKKLESTSSIEWRGSSDSETLVEMISAYGITYTLKCLNGMFAFAIWDKIKSVLTICRDRSGQKPLYYGLINGFIMFSSDISSFNAISKSRLNIDKDSINNYFKYSNIPYPSSIYNGVFKLPPASYMQIRSSEEVAKVEYYWSIHNICAYTSQKVDDDTYLKDFEKVLTSSVSRHMISDVPIGSLLSGGYDSTLVTAIAQKINNGPIKTYTIGSESKIGNEAEYARKVAKYLGTDHTELYIQPEDFISCMDIMPKVYGEPFSDYSQVPMLLVSQLASQDVKVALSGDGADELFKGYNRYTHGEKIWELLKNTPKSLKIVVKFLLKIGCSVNLDILQFLLPKISRIPDLNIKLHKILHSFEASSDYDFYSKLISRNNGSIDLIKYKSNTIHDAVFSDVAGLTYSDQMAIWDFLTYLPNDILTKVDRSSMAYSLEMRSPFLDNEIIDFSWGVSRASISKNKNSKWPIKQLTHKYVPKRLMERPKQGFGFPLGEWLCGPCRGWAEDLLQYQSPMVSKFINKDSERKMWLKFIDSNGSVYQDQIWSLLMFKLWMKNENTYSKKI
jgi:asparagine synthase (glutamine-hydrolysing)